MYSDEYLRDLEMSANLNKQEKMICPICGREFKKWLWRSDCCGAELVWIEKGGRNGYSKN